MMATKGQIVYISSIPWDYAWHRQQEMASKMAEKGFEILFVQPCTKNPFKNTLVQQEKGIWLLSPSGLPYERVLRCANGFNARVARKQILKAMDKIGFQNPIVWLDRVHGFDFKFFSKTAYVVYDLIDEILAFGRIRNEKMLLSLENKVLKRTDLLISSSKTLADRKLIQSRRLDQSYLFIPNGVDVQRFAVDATWEAVKDIPHPRIGFVGTISARRLNCELLKEVIKRNPAWNFVFVGPQDGTDIKALSGENVRIFDAVAGEKIPEVVASFDVGIIPYNVDNATMDYVFPRKACEFLATGKPVVSTPLSEMKVFGDYAIIADTPLAFERGIQIALSQENQEQNRRDYAKQFDWDMLLKGIVSQLPEREERKR